MRMVPKPRWRGFTLVELLGSLLLLMVVVQGAWTVLARHRRAAEHTGAVAEGLETVRTLSWLLPQEFSGGRPGEDWWTEGGDSVRLRAFRGWGLVQTGRADPPRVTVCFRGVRSPNPEKDSVLMMDREGSWRAYGLQGRVKKEEGCEGWAGSWVEEWLLDAEAEGWMVGRIFERGSYHISDGALRYRRGNGGRQPMTPLRIESGVFLRGQGDGPPLAWEITLTPGPPSEGFPFWRGVAR